MTTKTDLIPRNTVETMLANVHQAQADIEQAFALLQAAKQRLTLTLGESRDAVFGTYKLAEYDLPHAAADAAKAIERNAWKAVVDKLRVREVLSVKKREALDKQLLEGELPELTSINIFAFCEQLSNDMGSLLEDSAREVFNWLRPNFGSLKTNNKNIGGLKKKVIKTGVMHDSYGHYPTYVDTYHDKYIQALDNVFHLLDGKGVAKYPDTLAAQISKASADNKDRCETEYFRCVWYGNRNLHIEFKRMDLVQQLNKLAGSDKLAA